MARLSSIRSDRVESPLARRLPEPEVLGEGGPYGLDLLVRLELPDKGRGGIDVHSWDPLGGNDDEWPGYRGYGSSYMEEGRGASRSSGSRHDDLLRGLTADPRMVLTSVKAPHPMLTQDKVPSSSVPPNRHSPLPTLYTDYTSLAVHPVVLPHHTSLF